MAEDQIKIASHPARTALIEEVTSQVIARGGSGGHIGGMETRVTRLEVEFEHIRKDLDEIKADVKTVVSRLGELPTKRDLNSNLQWVVAVSAAVLALFVAVLAYLQDQRIAGSPQGHQASPIIIQVPAAAPTPATPSTTPEDRSSVPAPK